MDDPEPGVVFKDNGRDGTRLYWKSLFKSLGMTEFEAEFTVSQCDGLLVEDPSPEQERLYLDCVAPVQPECVEADPADGCFGMCGNGCNCWAWVCGDCCVHPGCQIHDWTCGEGIAVLGCVLPLSLLAAPLLCGPP